MSPPVIAPQTAFGFAKPDSAQSSESGGNFNFSSASTDAARFDYSKTGADKPRISGRSRPRLMKMRRRKMPDGVKTDLGLNGFSGSGGEKDFEGKLGGAFGINNGSSGSNGGEEKSRGLNENVGRFGNGFGFDVDLNNSLFGFGSGKFTPLVDATKDTMPSNRQSRKSDISSGFDIGSSNFGQKESGSFVFGACKEAPVSNPDLCGQFVFGVGDSACSRDSSFNMKEASDSASQVKLEQQGSHKSRLSSSADEFVKFNAVKFEIGAGRTDKFVGSTIHDIRGKVKLDSSGASEKVSDPVLKFPFNVSDGSSNDRENFVFTENTDFKFNIGLGNKSSGGKVDVPNFRKSGKENAEIGSQSHVNGVFVFGGLKGKQGINSGGTTKPVSEMNELNMGKAEESNIKFQTSGNSGGSFEQGPTYGISNEMKKLNIGDPKVDTTRSGSFSCNSASGADNLFVFGGNQQDSGFVNENCPSMNRNTPDLSRFSQSNSKSTRTYSTSVGMGFNLNSGFQEVPSIDKDKNENIRDKLAGLGSDADCITPDMKFAFSSNNLFPGVDKLGNTKFRSVKGKTSKKRNGKLGQRTFVQQLFPQSQMFKEGSSQQNHTSPGCGSPMDFSPYQDTSASNAPEADTASGLKVDSAANQKNISDDWENPEDGKSNSVCSHSLPAEDGLSAIKHKYKKKYRLRVGLNPTVQGNNSRKENVKLESSGTSNELCEHWRIRGNEAYHAGKLSKAEELYSMGIDSVSRVDTTGYPLKPLLLCYSNRAATRMSLSRMREAIADCTKASELDPDFMKVILRAGNCYLVLGEVEDAIQCYRKCLGAENSICLDRRFTIEAASSLQKAEKVAECMHQSAILLQEGTDDAAGKALGSIEEALSTCRYSERLLQMKGEAMYSLRMYEEVIQLCEQTLDIAMKNLRADLLDNQGDSSHVKLWRWRLQSKSHYSQGRLDVALELIEKQKKVPISSMCGDLSGKSSSALATNIRELLSLKKSGNEAFNSGRYTEAIDNYTIAISKSFESRAFMAVCFCNRAAAYQSLSQIVDAISDCSVAIALDEDYAKAISRRATLHEMIRDYKQALNDSQRLVLLLETQSKSKTQSRSSGSSGVRDLRKARRRLATVEEKAKKDLPLDFYLILGINASDAESEIKKAYRKAALRHHPDKAGQVFARNDAGDDGKLWKECGEKIHNDADRLFKIIGEAYAVLSDSSKRSKYDIDEEIRNNYRDSNRNGSYDEEIRNNRDSNRNGSCGHPSTSYSSPNYNRSWSGRSGTYSTSYGGGRSSSSSSSRRNWYE
ncbi:uncharacterized protein LOC121795176 isoform X1 [Salvia splendens]|uniref:uncharacterized protein LOC121795176 isoform X1 n=1 Tax=Salvia splendens TaxID=180675 RepID=UPI001C2659B5|nr:uncharacterized protein LOC121795176 isoform X1 [Salvia splendens]